MPRQKLMTLEEVNNLMMWTLINKMKTSWIKLRR